MTATLSFVLCLVVCGVAALTDWRSCRIPNWLTLAAIALGLGLGATNGVEGALASLVGALVCGLAPLVLCLLGAMGGGDFKLLAAVGALLGARLGLEAELWSFVAASAWGIGMWMVRGRLVVAARRVVTLVTGRSSWAEARVDATRIRFAPSVLAGVLVALAGFVGVA